VLVGPFGSTTTQLVQLTLPAGNAGPVIGTVISNLPVGNVTGADISPTGQLAFVASDIFGTRLFFVNPAVNNPATPGDEVAATLTSPLQGQLINGTQTTIGSIAFLGNSLVAAVNPNPGAGGGGGGGGGGASQVVSINPTTGQFQGAPTNITIGGGDDGGGGGGAGQPIVGLDVDSEGNVVAIQSGDDASVLALQDTGSSLTGAGFELGGLGNSNLTSLAFVPGVTDPFTSSTAGAFVAVDGQTDQLVFVNAADRNPGQYLFNVFVTSSDITGKIAIGFVRDIGDDNPPPFIRPFFDAIPDLSVTNAQSGDQFEVSAPANSGKAFIGALSQDIDPDDDLEDAQPYPAQDVPSAIDFGTLPRNVTRLAPGLVVAQGQDLGKFLLGGTITGAVDARGSIDHFYAGWVLTGDTSGQSEGSPTVPDNFRVAATSAASSRWGRSGPRATAGPPPRTSPASTCRSAGPSGRSRRARRSTAGWRSTTSTTRRSSAATSSRSSTTTTAPPTIAPTSSSGSTSAAAAR
jgi:hypothetical protein